MVGWRRGKGLEEGGRGQKLQKGEEVREKVRGQKRDRGGNEGEEENKFSLSPLVPHLFGFVEACVCVRALV